MATTSVHLPKLLSMEDWDALPEDNGAHIELQEGVLIVAPRPLRPHARAVFRIAKQLDEQLPDDLEAIIAFELCVDDAYPPTVRIPDVVITRKEGPERRLNGAGPGGRRRLGSSARADRNGIHPGRVDWPLGRPRAVDPGSPDARRPASNPLLRARTSRPRLRRSAAF